MKGKAPLRDDATELAEILRFQESLLRLVNRGVEEQAKSKGETTVAVHAHQLKTWAERLEPKGE